MDSPEAGEHDPDHGEAGTHTVEESGEIRGTEENRRLAAEAPGISRHSGLWNLPEEQTGSSTDSAWLGADTDTFETPFGDQNIRLAPGSVVPGSRYRIVAWLGEGASGVVFEGAHIDLERRVALKILRIEGAVDVDRAATFRREARTASRVRSRYVAEVLDFLTLPDGRLMFVMELVPGGSLAKTLREDGRMSPARALPILRQLCKALGAAHSEGVVHRDVKPDNVLLYRDGTRGDALKLVDFGVATMLSMGEAVERRAVGTPRYMAPELIRGAPSDHRVDVYALGCTAYEMLCGRPPFVGKTVDEILEGHQTRAPKPLRARKAEVGTELEAVVARCLAKDPADRFADVGELEAALCEAQLAAGIRTTWDDLPLPPGESQARIGVRWRRNGRRSRASNVVSLALGGVLGMGLLGGVGWLQAHSDRAIVDADQVAYLVRQARSAAAAARYVYPDPSKPGAPTAYTFMRRLEALGGPLAVVGAEEARLLRGEFATALSALGDYFHALDGGRPIAAGYYLQALIFQPDHARASERAYATPSERRVMRSLAERGEWNEEALREAEILVDLARAGTESRQLRLQRWLGLSKADAVDPHTGLSSSEAGHVESSAAAAPDEAELGRTEPQNADRE